MRKKALMLLAIIAIVASAALPFTSVDAASKKKKTTTTTTTQAVAKEPVTMYVFYAGYCGYCSALHSYLDNELTKDEAYKDKFNVVYIEIADEKGTAIAGNNEMFSVVADHFEYTKGGIPFYIVGDQYLSGYSEELQSSIKKMIDEEYNDKKYKDVVSTLIDVKSIVFPEAEKETENTKNNNMIGYIILGITAVIIIAIIFGRSKTSYYEEV